MIRFAIRAVYPKVGHPNCLFSRWIRALTLLNKSERLLAPRGFHLKCRARSGELLVR